MTRIYTTTANRIADRNKNAVDNRSLVIMQSNTITSHSVIY